MSERTRTRLSRWLRWRPAHFALAGALLFGVSRIAVPGADPGAAPEAIRVSQARIDALRAGYERRTGLAADPEVEAGLIEGWVEEEILYREALLRGLGLQNPAVLLRLRQKLEFLGEANGEALTDEATVERAVALGLADEDLVLRNMFVRNMRILLSREADRDPSPEELAAWYAGHADEFRRPARLSWRHVLVHRDRGQAAAEASLVELRRGGLTADAELALGDAFHGGHSFPGATREGIAGRFGEVFAEALFHAPPAQWSGPIASPFGLHLVFVETRDPERTPALEDVRTRVLHAWRRERRDEHLRRVVRDLRDRHPVIFENRVETEASAS
jgi:hypothetical protein